MARHPSLLYGVLLIVWLSLWSEFGSRPGVSRDAFLMESALLQGAFVIAPAGVVWAHLEAPPAPAVITVWRKVSRGAGASLASTWWVAVSVGVGVWVGKVDDIGGSALGALVTAVMAVAGLVILVRYIQLVSLAASTGATARDEATERFGSRKALWPALRTKDAQWFNAHAWRMATTPAGGVTVAISAALVVFAYGRLVPT
jgi:hypothetical protein